MPTRHRVLILSAGAGTGHLRAAEALEQECRRHPEIGDVLNVDTLTYTNQIFRQFYSKFYLKLVTNVPTLLGWFYESSDEPWKTDKMRRMLNRMNTRPLARMIRKFDPDITICTHFLPAEIISHLMSKNEFQTRLCIVVTDFEVHAMWLSRVFHHYFVAIDEARAHLAMMGFPSDHVTVSGIPIDSVFAVKKNRQELRLKHGVDPDLPMVLVCGGAQGLSSAEEIVRVLMYMHSPAEIVVACGSSRSLQEKVRRELKTRHVGHLKFRVMGYTTEMDEWMKMADLYIGKPGGLTTAELLVCGLPMIIFEPIPGQEERNSDHLLELGVAMKCNQLTTMPYKVDQLLQNPAKLKKMSAAARALSHPYAAHKIIQTLLDQFNTGSINMPKEIAST